MPRCEQCEGKIGMTITAKTRMDKGSQACVNSVNSLNPPTCAGACVCAMQAAGVSSIAHRRRVRTGKEKLLACWSLKTIHTLHRRRNTNGDNNLFGKGHSVMDFTLFTVQEVRLAC